MIIRIAIVDDEESVAKEIEKNLDRFSKENNVEIRSTYFENGAKFLSQYTFSYDVVFMDIDMGENDENGIEISKKLREIDKDVILIFVTNLSQFAIRGYEVNALDFIIKPVSYYVLSMKLKHIINKLKLEKRTSLKVVIDNSIYSIDTNTIKYIEVFHHKLIFHTLNKDYVSYGSLKEIESRLEEEKVTYFVRCNSYLLVNMNYIQSLKGYDLNVDGTILPVSQPKRKELVLHINDFLRKGGK